MSRFGDNFFQLIYKGEAIAQGTKADFHKQIKEIGRKIHHEKWLIEVLEKAYKKNIFDFEEFSKSVVEFATDSELTKTSYIVIKPILKVKKEKIIPWFDQKGLGIEYELSKNIDKLLKSEYIKIK